MYSRSSRSANKGFTIVEIVVVLGIMAILATIVIVSYTGIQNRTRQENAKNSALFLQRKLQAYYNVVNNYPDAPATATSQLNAQPAAKLNSSVTLGTPTTYTGERTVKLELCTASGVAYRITYWDYTANSLPGTAQLSGGAGVSTCSAWATAA